MKIKALTKWKSVDLDPNLQAKGFSEGLLGIEVLSDYQLVGKAKSVEGKAVRGPPSPSSESVEQGKPLGAGTGESGPRAKKKKRCKKKKNRKASSQAEEDAPEGAPERAETDRGAKGELEFDRAAWTSILVPDELLKTMEGRFVKPTAIQQAVLPAAIGGRMDIVGAAETGSGKTLAFGLPLLANILADKVKEGAAAGCEDGDEDDDDDEGAMAKSRLRALVLAPTRELAVQVRNHLKAVAPPEVSVAAVVGGMSVQKQTRLLAAKPDIVVATPGRLWDLIEGGNPHLSGCGGIDYLVIDETDRMVEKGHFEELARLLEVLNEGGGSKRRQTFVFSATLSLVHDLPGHLEHTKKRRKKLTSKDKLKQIMDYIGVKDKVKVVDLTRKVGTAEGLVESKINCSIAEKDEYLYYFLQMHPGRTLVFCNSIDCVRRLVNLFQLLKVRPMGLHAQMQQRQRLKNLDRFVADPSGLLVATDVAARGLDIKDVQHVIHYQVPRTSESYVHRSGRTARAEKEGISVMLIDPSENQLYRQMCRTLNRDEDLPCFPIEGKIFANLKKRVLLARDLDKLLLSARKEEVNKSWLRKAAEEADIQLSDEDALSDGGRGVDEMEQKARQKKLADRKAKSAKVKMELEAALAQPIISQGFSGKYPTQAGYLQLPKSTASSSVAYLQGEASSSAISKLAEDSKLAKGMQKLRQKSKQKNQVAVGLRKRKRSRGGMKEAEEAKSYGKKLKLGA